MSGTDRPRDGPHPCKSWRSDGIPISMRESWRHYSLHGCLRSLKWGEVVRPCFDRFRLLTIQCHNEHELGTHVVSISRKRELKVIPRAIYRFSFPSPKVLDYQIVNIVRGQIKSLFPTFSYHCLLETTSSEQWLEKRKWLN